MNPAGPAGDGVYADAAERFAVGAAYFALAFGLGAGVGLLFFDAFAFVPGFLGFVAGAYYGGVEVARGIGTVVGHEARVE